MRATKWGCGLAIALAWAVAGCGAKSSGSQVSLSARATSAAVTESAPAGLKVDDHVTLTRVRIVIRDVKLESRSAGATPTPTPTPSPTATSHADDSAPGGVENETEDEQEHGEEVEVHAGPVLLDLGAEALTASKLQEALAVTVPAGTYDELKLRIHPLEDGEKTGDADVDAARASVILDGTYDGAAFRFVSQLSAKQKLEGAFTVGGSGGSNITLDIDVSGWFSADGMSLDPRSASNQAAIEQNIRRSLRAFDDRDHDGRDDHGEHGTATDDGGQGSGESGGGGSSGGSDDGANHT